MFFFLIFGQLTYVERFGQLATVGRQRSGFGYENNLVPS